MANVPVRIELIAASSVSTRDLHKVDHAIREMAIALNVDINTINTSNDAGRLVLWFETKIR